MPARINYDREKLVAYCRKWKVKRLSLFGSVLRDDFSNESDVDVLYELEDGHSIGYFTLAEMEMELSALFEGRRVDLVNPKYLKPGIREEVLRTAEVGYVAA